MASTLTARERLIARIEAKFCPNSTDCGLWENNHRISAGACESCDRSIDALAWHYGITS